MRTTWTDAPRTALVMAGFCALLMTGPTARAQEPEATGRFISVPSPLGGESVSRIRQAVDAEVKRFKDSARGANARVFKAVFDFNPDGKPNRSDEFEFCLALARHIAKVQQEGGGTIQTVAFVQGEVSGHAVLPVLACQQIVFSKKAKLGPVVHDGAQPFDEAGRLSYESIGKRFRPVLIQKLWDRDLIVVPSKTGGWTASTAADAAPGRPLFEAGRVAVYDFAKAKEAGICELDPREDRVELARAYRLARGALAEAPLADRPPVCARIPVPGEITGGLRELVDRRIGRALRAGANLIILELRCHGGDVDVASGIAQDLLNLNKERADNPVVTVAYLTPDASDTATYLALACDHLVMDPRAKLGGFGKVLKGKPPKDLDALGRGMEAIAESRFYPRPLARAFVDSGVENLFLVETAKGAKDWAILTGRELDEDRKARPGHWREPPDEIPLDRDRFLTLDADQAIRLGLAREKADDVNAIYASFGVQPAKVKTIGADWLDELADFLRTEWASYLLVMIGITCLILELKLPGVGLPGIIAALCFVLYFWSHSQLGGQVTWLAILLFLLGIVLLGIEIFVLPGFGVCGISGVILMVGSLALVAQGQWPQTGTEWVGLTKKIAPFGLTLMGAVVAALLLGRYLHHIPLARGLLLRPQSETEEAGGDSAPDPALAEQSALLGAIGVAATPLRPAGKVQFGDQFLDVVAEGSYVVPGTRVQVIEIEGNRIVVKAV